MSLGGRGIRGTGAVLGGSGISLSGGGGGFTGLLDDYGGAAAAYSVRRLSSTYEGSLIRVREDGGDTEADIGYDSNGDLDTTALLAHCGSNNGYVVTWYDQSGNSNDATQTTTSEQPQIVSSGSVELLNSKPTVKSFNNAWLSTSSNPVSDGYISVFNVNKNNAAGTNPIIDLASNINFGASTGVRLDRNGSKRWGTDGNFLTAANDTNRNLMTGIRGVSNRYFRINGSQVATSSVTGTQSFLGVSSLVLGAYYNESLSTDQYFQECIIYNSDKTGDESGIETNINTYFSIYSSPGGIGTWAIGTTFVIQ